MSVFITSSDIPMRPSATVARSVLICACVLWLLTVGIGMIFLMRHEQTPGVTADAARADRWPTGTLVGRGDAPYTVVMLAHPRCPCTRASLNELHILQAAARGRAKCLVFFMLPSGANDDWRNAPNWQQAGSIPDARIYDDLDGRTAALFGAETSGQVLIYDRAGVRRFSGGITGSRGQEGENPGLDAALRLVRDDVSPTGNYSVYGCPLHEAADPPATLTKAD